MVHVVNLVRRTGVEVTTGVIGRRSASLYTSVMPLTGKTWISAGALPCARTLMVTIVALVALHAVAVADATALPDAYADAPPLTDASSRVSNLSAYRGRVVLLNFWATWCVPCLKEMPDLNRVYAGLDPKRAVVVGVAADNVPEVAAFVQKLGVRYPIYAGDPDKVFMWSARLGNVAEGLPYSVLLDAAGKVRWSKSGGRITEQVAREAIAKWVKSR
jgi:thiol-disulfide isomerase/thioredoxin